MKLKLKIVNKLHELTGDEIDILFYISQFQNEQGEIKHIYYKDVCQTIRIHKSNFFKLMPSLEKKGFIKIDNKNDHPNYWHIDIINNDFYGRDSYTEGYLNLNFEILHSKSFYKLTKAEKLIVIHILTRFRDNQHYFSVTLDKLIEVSHCKKTAVKRFIKHLKSMEEFDMEKTPNGIEISRLSKVFGKRNKSEADVYNGHHLDFLIKKKKGRIDKPDFKEMLVIFKQYAQKISLESILEIAAYCMKHKNNWVIPKYINYLINEKLWNPKFSLYPGS